MTLCCRLVDLLPGPGKAPIVEFTETSQRGLSVVLSPVLIPSQPINHRGMLPPIILPLLPLASYSAIFSPVPRVTVRKLDSEITHVLSPALYDTLQLDFTHPVLRAFPLLCYRLCQIR